MERSHSHLSPRGCAWIAAALALFMLGGLALLASAARGAPSFDIPTDFGWAPGSPAPGEVVTFTADASPPGGVSIKGYDWDFNGDGSFDAHGRVATWAFATVGPRAVHLRVRGNGPHRGEAVHSVIVQPPAGGGGGNAPPVASFDFTPNAPLANEPVQFSSTATDDGTITEQVWDLNGDGAYDNGGGPTALRTFAAPGEYVVGLRVTDDGGLVSFFSRTITVQPAVAAPLSTQGKSLRLLSPFPLVRIAGRIGPRGTRVRLLRVDAPTGAKVSIRCAGRGCPFRKQVRAVSTPVGRSAAVVRVRRLERFLRAGVKVRIFVTKPEAVGKYTRFRFRAGKAPARVDRCVLPGQWAPVDCPAS